MFLLHILSLFFFWISSFLILFMFYYSFFCYFLFSFLLLLSRLFLLFFTFVALNHAVRFFRNYAYFPSLTSWCSVSVVLSTLQLGGWNPAECAWAWLPTGQDLQLVVVIGITSRPDSAACCCSTAGWRHAATSHGLPRRQVRCHCQPIISSRSRMFIPITPIKQLFSHLVLFHSRASRFPCPRYKVEVSGNEIHTPVSSHSHKNIPVPITTAFSIHFEFYLHCCTFSFLFPKRQIQYTHFSKLRNASCRLEVQNIGTAFGGSRLPELEAKGWKQVLVGNQESGGRQSPSGVQGQQIPLWRLRKMNHFVTEKIQWTRHSVTEYIWSLVGS